MISVIVELLGGIWGSYGGPNQKFSFLSPLLRFRVSRWYIAETITSFKMFYLEVKVSFLNFFFSSQLPENTWKRTVKQVPR